MCKWLVVHYFGVVPFTLVVSNADSHPNEVAWKLKLPQSANVVPDSAKSKVILNSDILGSTLEVNTILCNMNSTN